MENRSLSASHHTIAAHRLVGLAKVNTASQDWGNLFFKLSFAEVLKEVSARDAEEVRLYNEYTLNIWFNYIQRYS